MQSIFFFLLFFKKQKNLIQYFFFFFFLKNKKTLFNIFFFFFFEDLKLIQSFLDIIKEEKETLKQEFNQLEMDVTFKISQNSFQEKSLYSIE